MLIESFHSGRRGQRRYCSLHRPATRLVRSMGVVLCYPLGHEYYRAHRCYVKLADQLAQHGFPVMRFDYFGCGDSEGDAGHERLDAWLNDITAAVDELRRSEPVSGVALGGLRFGATLAMLAARRIDSVRALIAWDPVEDGRRYVDELAELHGRVLKDLERFPRIRDRDACADDEYVGTRYNRFLLRQIASIGATALGDPGVDDAVVAGDERRLAGLAAGWRSTVRVHAAPAAPDYGWQDEHRIEEAIVDPAVVRHMTASLAAIEASGTA